MGVGHDEMDGGIDRKGWGVKGVTERGEQEPQAIDGKRGEGWNEQARRSERGREEGGRVCGLRLP